MFKKLTKFIVSQVDPCKELVPVESIADNEHFRPLRLLIKKRKSERIFHSAPYYQKTGFTLDDVLLPGEEGKSIEFFSQDFSQFTLTKVSADQVDGGLSISFDPANAELKGSASFSKGFSIKAQKKSVPLQSLEALKKERKINMDHSLIQRLRRTNTVLYVVTEILEASEEAVYKESTKAHGGFMGTFYATLFAKGTRENSQGIVIPKGCTLAFKTSWIHIRDEGWDVHYFLKGGGGITRRVVGVRRQGYVADGALTGRLKEVVREVQYSCRIFPELSPDLLLIILNTIKAVMRDKNLLQELSQKMEDVPKQNDGYELKTESPELKDLFSNLQHSPRDRLLLLAEGIIYILDALHELMDNQLLLLLESLERKIVSQQLKLVAHILRYDLEYGMCPFSVNAALLSFPHKEEQMLTMELVELSGVQLQEDGSAVPRGQPFEAVAALFVALDTLNLLSGSGWTYPPVPRDPFYEMFRNVF